MRYATLEAQLEKFHRLVQAESLDLRRLHKLGLLGCPDILGLLPLV